jgi:hypothetical protein
MRIRAIAALVAGCLLVLSSMAHAFLGWPAVLAELNEINASAEFISGLRAGWLFGSTSMLAFGLIVLVYAVQLWRGKDAERKPSAIIAVCYLIFGIGAFFTTNFDPHFIGFIVIGLIVGFASTGIGKRVE